MSRKLRTAARAVLAVVLVTGSVLAASAAPAQAAWSCAYPYACLYDAAGRMVERYQVVTSGWQSFSRTDVYRGRNTRNDDVVFIRYTNGAQRCIVPSPPGEIEFVYNLRAHGVPNGIRISSSSSCGGVPFAFTWEQV